MISILISILLFNCTIMGILYAFSDKGRPERNLSFSRTFVPGTLKTLNTMELKYNSYYIAGRTEHKIYLGNSTGFLNVISADPKLTDSSHIKISLKNIEDPKFKYPFVKIYDPYFYITDGVQPSLFRGLLGEWEAAKFMKDSAFFINALPMAPDRFIIKTMQSSSMEYTLGILGPEYPYLKLRPLLEKQLDGVFCVDGKLHYNDSLKRMVYVYYYRNEFIVSDKDLNLIYKGKTLDTFSRVSSKSMNVNSGNRVLLSSQPRTVNKTSALTGNLIFINSNIMGSNDDEYRYLRSSVIDIFEIRNGQYLFSFYLPGFNGRAAREFIIMDHYLIALYSQYLVSYDMGQLTTNLLYSIYPDESGK